MSKIRQSLCDGVGTGQLPKVRQADLVAPQILSVSQRQSCQGWRVIPLIALADRQPAAVSSRTRALGVPSPGVHRHAVPLPRAEELAAPLLLLCLFRPPIDAAPVPQGAPAPLAGLRSLIFHLLNTSVADCRTEVDSRNFHFPSDF